MADDEPFTEDSLLSAIVAHWGPFGAHADLCRSMIAEIRRLRSECATADLIEDQQDEIERLREELDSFGTTRKALRDKIRLRTIQRDEARTEASMKGYRLDDALDEIERLRAAGDALFNYLHDHHGSEIVRAAWQEARYG